MTSATRLIRREADRLAAVLAQADPSSAVPTCPGWTAADLLWHLTEVEEFWSAILQADARTDADIERIEAEKAPRPDGPDAERIVLTRRAAATARLTHHLTLRTDAEPSWTWFGPDRTVGFIRRMQLHEATVHRVDAELTAGLSVTLPEAAVATDGVAHLLDVMMAASYHWIPDWARISPAATIDLVITDAPDAPPHPRVQIDRLTGTDPATGQAVTELLARRAPDAAPAATALPHAVATGDAVALYLWGWGRGAALDHLADGAVRSAALSGDDDAVAIAHARIAQGIE